MNAYTSSEGLNRYDVHASACELCYRHSVLFSSHVCRSRTSLKESFRSSSQRMLHPQSNHGCLLRYWQRPHEVTEDNRRTNFALQGIWSRYVVLPSVRSSFYRVSAIIMAKNGENVKWSRYGLHFLSLCSIDFSSSQKQRVFLTIFFRGFQYNGRFESLSSREDIEGPASLSLYRCCIG